MASSEQYNQPRERTFSNTSNENTINENRINENTNNENTSNENITAASPPIQYKDLYPDPPPSYEEYCSEIADDGQGQTPQEPIQTQPQSHRVQVIDVQQQQLLNGVPELLCLSSIGLSVLCLFICPCVLVCTLPAIGASTAAKSELINGNVKRGKFNLCLATVLDITAVIVAVTLIIVSIIVNKYVNV
ncbi:uncharacterized protein [Dysidea avara]|uniref:uncharacterized protein n=1 Tax=Dysidea avara TaxID=196820 RepID=UPI0033214357